MNARRLGYGVAMGLAFGCGAREAKSVRERLPENLVLRVDRVDVAATVPGTRNRWDGPEPEGRADVACSLFAIGMNLVSPVSGDGVQKICGTLFHPADPERSREDPDLRVRLSAGTTVSLESPVTRDVTSHSFGYSFVVPSAGVPADGIRIEILDDDGASGPQSIGVARLTLETLARAYESPSHVFTTSSGAVSHLEVVVSPYSPMDIPKRRMLVTGDPEPIGARPLVAGEIVHLRAEGSYRVGKWYDAALGPSGYADDSARRYNFAQEPFASGPHAAGIAIAGQDEVFVGALVAPCVTFTSLYAGALRVGINDTDPLNNEGFVAFEGFARAPTVEEWGRRFADECR